MAARPTVIVGLRMTPVEAGALREEAVARDTTVTELLRAGVAGIIRRRLAASATGTAWPQRGGSNSAAGHNPDTVGEAGEGNTAPTTR